MVTVPNMRTLQAMKNHEDGEIALVEDTKRLYRYDQESGMWDRYNPEGGLKLSLLELNKTAIPQLPTLNEEEIEKGKQVLEEYMRVYPDDYYLLLSNSYKYYTFFIKDSILKEPIGKATIPEELLSCIPGEIKSINLTGDGGAVEIWSVIDDTAYEFYFFKYGEGVIVCQQ